MKLSGYEASHYAVELSHPKRKSGILYQNGFSRANSEIIPGEFF
jgi:hypothetical protein